MKISEIVRDFPQISISIQASDLLAFGEQLVADTLARQEEALKLKTETSNELITDKEAQLFFGVSTQTLWRWRKRGYLQGVPVGGRIKYRRQDCEQIMKSKER